MSFSTVLDLSTDYLVWDDLQTATIYPAPRSDSTKFTVENVANRSISERELLQGNGAYVGTDRVWLLSYLELTGYVILPGDIITQNDEGTPGGTFEYTVLSPAQSEPLTQTFRLMTRNLALNVAIRDKVTILRPLIAQGAAAEPVYNWAKATAIVTDMPCRAQPQVATVETHNEVESSAKRYDVILGQQVTLQKDDRFKVTLKATGEVILLQWIEHRNAERIDELPAVTCVRVG